LSKILVTGAKGFIGTPLVRRLEKQHSVVALSRSDGDVADPKSFDRLDDVDHVFHLAGRTFVPESWTDPLGFINSNVLGTGNVLAYCRRVSAKLTFVSAYIYGKPESLPVREDAVPRPNNPYALSKHLAEQLCEFGARTEGLDVTVVRPFNIYGPGQPDRFLVPTIVSQVRAGESIRVMDLMPKRDYLHVDDLVELLVSTIEASDGPYRVVNAGSGESYSVQQIVDLIQVVAGTRLPVIDAGKPRQEELDDVRADISRARDIFGWSPRITLRSGIEQLVKGADASQSGRTHRKGE
jgi:nucleoside-diphosphate-sugar epimerase